MRFDRLRTRGAALILTMVVVVAVGAGGGLAVTDFAGTTADTQPQSFQSGNATGVESDGDGQTETPTPEPEEAGAGEEDETATETRPATDAPTSTPGPSDAAVAAETESAVEETESSDEATDGNETATEEANAAVQESPAADESNDSADGELSTCTEIDEPGEYELTADVGGGSGTCIAVESSNVVLDGNGHTVAGSGSGTGIQVAGETSDVTVRNVDVSDWGVAVKLGGGVSGPQANLVEVRATGSDTGVRLVEADGSAMQAVTARDNGDGVVLVDTADVQASDVTVDGNDGTGLWLARGVSDSSFSIVQATANGEQGIYVGTGAVDNFVGDATVTDNGGAGVEFSDSSNNVLADSRVEENGGPGVLSYPAGGDRLENVDISGNGDGAYRDQGDRTGAVGDTVRLRDGASVQFDQGVTHLAAAGTPETLPDGTEAAGPALEVTFRNGEDGTATMTVPVDASGDVTAYQRVDGNWQELTDTTVTNGEAEIPVSGSGVVVPVVETTSDEQTETGTDGDTVRADTSSDGEPAGDAPAASDDSASSDGSAASGERSASGETAASEEPAANQELATSESSDTSATDEEAANPDATDGGQAGSVDTADSSANQDETRTHTLVVGPAADDTTIDYTLWVDGNVSKVTDGNVTAESNDTISRTNGAVLVDGTTATADAYVVDGELRMVRESMGTPGYFLRYGATVGGNETGP